MTDDNKAKVYNKALEAVNAYNEAVLQSEDAFNDENVEKARQSLEDIKNTIENDDS